MSHVPATTPPTSARFALLLTIGVLALAGCSGGSATITSGGSVTPTSSGPPSTGSPSQPASSGPAGSSSGAPSSQGASAAGPADLTIVVDDGAGHTTTWHLTCSPAGGTHPDPARACAVLAEHGRTALPPVPPGRMCTQMVSGSQTARITGSWEGTAVDARLSQINGCETARWRALLGLLPPGGS
jgi:hypothetical protein